MSHDLLRLFHCAYTGLSATIANTSMVVSVPSVQASARSTLVSLVQDHISSLVQEASCVQRHCKRARMHAYGDNEQSGIIRRRLHADDINMALQWRGSEKIYATGTIGKESSESNKVNLEDYLKSEMDLRPPQEVGLTVHWLAVDGVQPDIPQNPGSQSKEGKEMTPQSTVTPSATEEAAEGGIHVTQLLPRLLSEELRLYFTRVTSAVERGGATTTARQQQDAALAGIARDPGLQELVPFLVLYVSQSLSKHLGNPEHCRTLIRMARSLLQNRTLHLELHVRAKGFLLMLMDLLQTYNLPRHRLVASTYSSAPDLCGCRAVVITGGGQSLDIAKRSCFNFGASVSCVSTSSIAYNR